MNANTISPSLRGAKRRSNLRLRLLRRCLDYGLAMTAVLLCISNFAFAELEQPSEQTPTDLSKQTLPGESYKLQRLGDGVANILYGPLELFHQFGEEIKLSDPVRGFVPGIIRGFAWFGMREAAGISEIATFYVPAEPPLEPFDTSWLRA